LILTGIDFALINNNREGEKMKTPKTFREMANSQLRQYINGCHATSDYGLEFESACRELNRREGD